MRFATLAALALGFGAAQQLVKLLRHQLAMGVELIEQMLHRRKTQRCGDPAQIGVLGWQHVGLLVVQVLDAVLDLAQKLVALRQCLGCFGRHQSGFFKPVKPLSPI